MHRAQRRTNGDKSATGGDRGPWVASGGAGLIGWGVPTSPVPKRALCEGCARPPVVCVCAHVTPLRTRTRVLILQHPRERHVPINTARLARLSLPDAILRRAVDFETDPVVLDALTGKDGGPPPYLLFPGPNAIDLAVAPPPGPITLVVLDGTWWQAGKLLRRNPRLATLPQLRLAPAAPSRYRIRREPHDHCVATIEAIALALRALEGEGAGASDGQRFDDARVAALLAPFDAMVEHQLAFRSRIQDARHLRSAIARGPRTPRRPRIPGLEALRAAGERLVVVHGEANAWPVRVPGHPAPEIVHWLAWRPATGERFEAVVRPRAPLAPSAPVQLRLDAATLAAGEPWDAFRARWEAFSREDDVLCGWGHFPTGTLEREDVRVPVTRLDVRVAANALLGARIGTAEECARRLEEASHYTSPKAADDEVSPHGARRRAHGGAPAHRGRAPPRGRGARERRSVARLVAVAQAREILAELDLLDHGDDHVVVALGRQAERLAHAPELLVLGELDLAVGGVDARAELEQAALDGERLVREGGGGRRQVEALGRELLDAEVEVHGQRGRLEDLAQQALDGRLLLALERLVGVGGVHEEVGDERQAVFHGRPSRFVLSSSGITKC